MRQTLVSLAAMFASLALLIAGSNLLGTLLPMRLTLDGFSAPAVGAVLVFYAIGFVAGTRLVVPVIRRVGQVRSFAAFAALACVAVLVHPMLVNGWLWALLRAVTGFCAAGLIIVLEGWISGRASNTTRGALLGIYQVVYFSAAAAGQFLVGAGSPREFPIYSLVAMLIALSLVPLALTREEAPLLGTLPRLGFRQLYRYSPSGLLGALTAGMVVSAFLSLAPVYVSNAGMSLTSVSHYMAFAVLATMALQWPLGRLSDAYDRRRLLAALAVFAALSGAAGAAFGSHWQWLLYAATGPVFGIAGCLYPISLAMINDGMKGGNPVAASAGLLFVYGLGTCVGPLGGSLAMALLGREGLFVFLALCLLALACVTAWRIRYTPDFPPDEQEPHVNVMAAEAAPAILELDPRTQPDQT